MREMSGPGEFERFKLLYMKCNTCIYKTDHVGADGVKTEYCSLDYWVDTPVNGSCDTDPFENCDDYFEDPVVVIKHALIACKDLADHYMKFSEDLTDDEVTSIRHLVSALDRGCNCDDYNGFDCGCEETNSLRVSAMAAIDALVDLQK